MLGLYLASVAYVNAEIKSLGPDSPLIAKSRESRVQHFLESIVTMRRDITDSGPALEEISKETPAFTKEQRETMASAVSTYMNGNDVANAGGKAHMQNHPNLAGYLTESLWSVLFDPHLSWDHKCEKFVSHCIEVLGLRNPNDATAKDILGILATCSKRQFTPDENRMEVRKIRAKFEGQRTFPNDVNEFLKRFPYGKSFLQCEPPVPSKVSKNELNQHTRRDRMPTRDNNKALTLSLA